METVAKSDEESVEKVVRARRTRLLSIGMAGALGALVATLAAGPAPLRAADGDLDSNFNPDVSFVVYGMAQQPDGKVVLGGSFARIGGTPRSCLARLNQDGTVDASFDPSPNSTVRCVVLQPDGAILIGGSFTNVGCLTRYGIARLKADGALDTGFDAHLGGGSLGSSYPDVRSMAVQLDGKIILGGGGFATPGSTTRRYLARVQADGSLDADFQPDVAAPVGGVAIQDDERILVADGNVLRFNPDGSMDNAFGKNATNHNIAQACSLALQPDGKILVGGIIPAGMMSVLVPRLNADGSLDTAFHLNLRGGRYASGFPGVYSVAVQADGKLLVGGIYTAVGEAARNAIVRVHSDGTLDDTFKPELAGSASTEGYPYVYSIVVQREGHVLLGGDFVKVDGQDRHFAARLLPGNDRLPASLFGPPRLADGWFYLTFRGVAFAFYNVLCAPSITGAWRSLGCQQCRANGLLDLSEDVAEAARFYRLVAP